MFSTSIKDFVNKIHSVLNDLEKEGEKWKTQQEEITRENIRRAGDSFINGRGDDFHYSDEQYCRFIRACSTDEIGAVKSLNRKRQTMKIHSSKYHSIIYNVSFHHCDCKDYERRLLPCKHMYKLALELGIIDENWDISGLSEEIKNKIESLDPETKSAFLNIINTNQAYSSFKYIKKRMPEKLFKSELLEFVFDDYLIINRNYTKNDIISSLVLSKSDFDITPEATKTSMILWIMDNDKKLVNKLARKYREVRYSFNVSSEYESIRRYYRDYMISHE